MATLHQQRHPPPPKSHSQPVDPDRLAQQLGRLGFSSGGGAEGTTTTATAPPRPAPPPPLRKAVYTKVDALTPASVGHNLVVRVLACDVVVDRRRVDGTPAKIAEVLVGDETGTVVLRARDEQVAFLAPRVGEAVVLRNCGVAMYRGYIRVVVNKWGKLSPHPDGLASTPPAPDPGAVNSENNKSAVEYELVVEEEEATWAEPGAEEEEEEEEGKEEEEAG